MKKQWKRYFRDGEVSPRAVAHLLGRLFYDTGYHTEYFFISFARGVRRAFQDVYKRQLVGHRCTQVFQGDQVLKLCETQSFDLVLLDIMMPGMDGFQVKRK